MSRAAADTPERRRRRLLRRLFRYRPYLLLLLFAAVIAVIVAQLGSSRRSYVMQARTHTVSIDFQGSSSKPWQLPTAVLCARRDGRASAATVAASDADAPCNPALFETVTLTNAIVEWPNGVGIKAAHGGGTGLDIQILRLPEAAAGQPPLAIDGHPVRANSRLIIPEAAWRTSGSLIFSGFMTLGTMPGGLESDHLIEGKYEVRETLLTGNPETVMQGAFFTGDEVRLINADPGDGVPVTGFLSPSHGDGADGDGIMAVAYSSLADSSMQIMRLGAAPSIIRPSWTDRALNDPLILALTALLALAVALLELIAKIRALVADDGE